MTQTLTTRPIPALIREIAVPASVGFFFNTMFNAVDTWYGGRISTQALAALSLSLPAFFLIIAVGRPWRRHDGPDRRGPRASRQAPVSRRRAGNGMRREPWKKPRGIPHPLFTAVPGEAASWERLR